MSGKKHRRKRKGARRPGPARSDIAADPGQPNESDEKPSAAHGAVRSAAFGFQAETAIGEHAELAAAVQAVLEQGVPAAALLEVLAGWSDRVLELLDAIEVAVAEHRELLDARDTNYAHLRLTHLAGERAWSLRSTLCFERGQHDPARKASTTANEHARQAARLERESLSDRVAALEAEVRLRRSLGDELSEIANDDEPDE